MTNSKITDPDVQTLAYIAGSLADDYAADDAWAGSPFEWLRTIPSRSKGAVGEKMVAAWAATRDFDVKKPANSQADRIIHGHRIEIKLSTLWASGGYKFQQIRDQEYDYCLCLGLSPFDASAWLLPKEILLNKVIGHMGQHTGASGKDTSWLGFPAGQPYDWMSPYGERLNDVAQILQDLGKGQW
ncbi:hypothetical protein QWJ06_00685 [Kocuria rhizophila]|uniref:hypothetical protein n=1 Tax=Kocuria rhizophila TaxID=72000 RepID=UPI001ABDA95C|nr:hypothetical protein [Kocuria rhizophila]MBO4145054.1 hypothetical protein [Kocuria rhizophila]MDN3225239.1 hypothetical protein [Kocuria rhizophila]QTK31748.1 hypothetical protein J5U48_00975 [Kocuria rhizophila]